MPYNWPAAVKKSTQVLAKIRNHSSAFFGPTLNFFLPTTQLRNPHKEDHKAVKEEEEEIRRKKESILHHFGARECVQKWPKSHQRLKDLTNDHAGR